MNWRGPVTFLGLVLALAAGCGYLMGAPQRGEPTQAYGSTQALNQIDIDGPSPFADAIGLVLIVTAISGPMLAIYCAFKKPVSLFLRRISIAALIIWTALGILLVTAIIMDAYTSGHSRDLINSGMAIALVIFLLVVFSWIYVLTRTKVRTRERIGRTYFG